jgi:hypothetical protein
VSLAFALFVLLALVAPGAGLQRWARVRVDPALVLPLGAALAAFAYWLSLATGLAWLFPLALAVAAFGLVVRRTGGMDPPLARSLWPAVAALVALLAATQYRLNRPASDGAFLLDPMGDQPLHAGITWELTLPYPPQVPGLAGVPLSYHFGADLVRAAALRWAGVHPYAPLNREEPTLWALALMLALGGLVRQLGGSRLALALVPWTVLLADFSFLCAALPDTRWWSDVFRANLLISLAFANPVVPALALALGCLIALARYESGEGRLWLVFALLQAAGVPWFKVFLGAQLALALALAALLAAWRRRRGVAVGPAAAWATALVASAAALALVPLLRGGTGEQVELVIAPLRMVRESLDDVGLDVAGAGSLALATVPWLAVALGLRSFGLAAAWRSLVGGSAAAAAAAGLALTGWPLGLLFHVAARDVEGRELPSATVYFVEQSGAVLWVFTALALAAWAERRRRPALTVAVAALLSLPSTLEFAVRKAGVGPDPVPPAVVRALDAVASDGRPGDVVLQRPGARYPPLPAVLVGRRVVYERFTPYLTQFAPRAELRRRHEALYRFFQTTDRTEALAIAGEAKARYVCLYGNDRVRFDGRGILVPLFEDPAARAYRIERDDGLRGRDAATKAQGPEL